MGEFPQSWVNPRRESHPRVTRKPGARFVVDESYQASASPKDDVRPGNLRPAIGVPWRRTFGMISKPPHATTALELTAMTIAPEERTLAALTHLSGLSGYVIPLGGVVVPIIIWAVKSDSKVIASVAKQALLLNVVVFVLIAGTVLLWLTVILIPLVIAFWILLGLGAIALPIVGAIKALDGNYYRYPVVGVTPTSV